MDLREARPTGWPARNKKPRERQGGPRRLHVPERDVVGGDRLYRQAGPADGSAGPEQTFPQPPDVGRLLADQLRCQLASMREESRTACPLRVAEPQAGIPASPPISASSTATRSSGRCRPVRTFASLAGVRSGTLTRLRRSHSMRSAVVVAAGRLADWLFTLSSSSACGARGRTHDHPAIAYAVRARRRFSMWSDGGEAGGRRSRTACTKSP